MNTEKRKELQEDLLYELKMYEVEAEAAVAMATFMEPYEQILLMAYMITHPDATAQEIVNESGRIIEQRKNTEK